MDVIDNAVRNVLYNKFSAGVFDKPYADLSRMSMLDNPQHRLLARQVAREATVLLKNDNNLLPLNPSNYKRIALIGPNTDDVSNTVGGNQRSLSNEGIRLMDCKTQQGTRSMVRML